MNFTYIDIPGWETYGEMKRRGFRWCSDAAFLVGDVPCCWACHEDADLAGYDLCGFEHDGMEFEVCCKIWGAYRKLTGRR